MVSTAEVSLALFAAAIAYLATPLIARAMRAIGHVRPDVHKPGRPLVPYSGGVALYIAITPSLLLLVLLQPSLLPQTTTLALVATAAFLVGLVDDFKVLGGLTKTALTLLAVLPVVAAHAVWPAQVQLGRPLVPVLGRLRLTIIYWLLLPLAVAGPANVVNMLDVFNGVMPASTLLATLALMISTHVIYSDPQAGILLAPLVGALVGYLPYNKWPARILNGDSGSLLVGAYIGAAALLTHTEFIAMIALMPHILNGALVIGSVRGLKEHRAMEERPVRILPDYRLAASRSLRAPISLTRIILALDGPLSEREVAMRLVGLGAVSSLMALASALLVPGW